MKKIFIIFICIFFISGCNYNQKEENIKIEQKESNNTLQKLKQEDIYNIEYEEDNKKIDNDIETKVTRVTVSSKKKDGSKNISDYLNKVIDIDFKEFEESIKEEYVKESNYIFDYKYSLVTQNNKYIIFKLHYVWQIGGPYPIDADKYYMFNINTGSIVEFDELFTKDVKKDVSKYIVNYLKDLYKENNIKYKDNNIIENEVFNVGYYMLNNNKLTFSLPRGSFSIPALGSITIDIDKSIYNSAIK